MNSRVIAALALVLVLGGLVGYLVALAFGDSDTDGSVNTTPGAASAPIEPTSTTAATDPNPTTEPTDGLCTDAAEVVAGANASIEQIVGSGTEPNVDYFAAIIVEQRTITFTMEQAPECFSLGQRAAAEGLLEGLRNLVVAASTGSDAVPLEIVPPAGDPVPTTVVASDG